MADLPSGPMRGSDTHSPRLDEQLAHEVDPMIHGSPDEGRTEGRRHEDVGPLEGSETLDRADITPVTPGLDEAALELRARLAAHVASVTFPATTDTLRDAARNDFAPADVMAVLDALPDDATFEAVGQIWRKAGGAQEHRS